MHPGGAIRDIGTGEIIPRAAFFSYWREKGGAQAVFKEMIQKFGGIPERP
jgi:hypothetical protein